jgi:hypothetical protein
MTTIKIHNVETGEVIEREMTPEELEQYAEDVASSTAKREAAAVAKQAADAAQAKLAILGLTADDLKALGL